MLAFISCYLSCFNGFFLLLLLNCFSLSLLRLEEKKTKYLTRVFSSSCFLMIKSKKKNRELEERRMTRLFFVEREEIISMNNEGRERRRKKRIIALILKNNFPIKSVTCQPMFQSVDHEKHLYLLSSFFEWGKILFSTSIA